MRQIRETSIVVVRLFYFFWLSREIGFAVGIESRQTRQQIC